MGIEVRLITEADIAGFRDARDSAAKFVTDGIAENVSQFVALAGPRVIGWANISPERAAAIKHCGSLRMGVGERLLVACIEKAQRNGISRIHLQVRVDNENAIGLYKHDALLMSLVTQTTGS